MLTVLKRSVAQGPEELTSPNGKADQRKNGSDVVQSFVSANSGTVCINLGDAGAMAYTHSRQPLLTPRSFGVVDDIFCIFEGILDNVAVLRQRYGLNKSLNEVAIVIEAYRTLRDRGPYPADEVVRELSGKFAFVLYDSTSQAFFTAVCLSFGALQLMVTLSYLMSQMSSKKDVGNLLLLFPEGAFSLPQVACRVLNIL